MIGTQIEGARVRARRGLGLRPALRLLRRCIGRLGIGLRLRDGSGLCGIALAVALRGGLRITEIVALRRIVLRLCRLMRSSSRLRLRRRREGFELGSIRCRRAAPCRRSAVSRCCGRSSSGLIVIGLTVALCRVTVAGRLSGCPVARLSVALRRGCLRCLLAIARCGPLLTISGWRLRRGRVALLRIARLLRVTASVALRRRLWLLLAPLRIALRWRGRAAEWLTLISVHRRHSAYPSKLDRWKPLPKVLRIATLAHRVGGLDAEDLQT